MTSSYSPFRSCPGPANRLPRPGVAGSPVTGAVGLATRFFAGKMVSSDFGEGIAFARRLDGVRGRRIGDGGGEDKGEEGAGVRSVSQNPIDDESWR